jgi:hypothetical protein
MVKENVKIRTKLFPVTYRNVLLEKKRTHEIGEEIRDEYVFYVDGEAKYYMKRDEILAEIEKWAKSHKADSWRVVKKILKIFDAHITGPPIMSMIFEWNRDERPEEVELIVIPMKELWMELSEEERLKLLK